MTWPKAWLDLSLSRKCGDVMPLKIVSEKLRKRLQRWSVKPNIRYSRVCRS